MTILPDVHAAPTHSRPSSRASSRPGSRASSSSRASSDCLSSSSDGSQSLSRISTASTLPSVSDSWCEVSSRKEWRLKAGSLQGTRKTKDKHARSSSLPSLVRKPQPGPEDIVALGKRLLEAKDMESCLLEAALTNDVSAIKGLALMDQKNFMKSVNYALIYAIRGGSYDAVQALFWHGASHDAKAVCSQLTVWDFAERSPEPEMMKSFLGRMKTGHMASEQIQGLFMGFVLPKSFKEQSLQRKRGASSIRRAVMRSESYLRRISTI